jgi:dimethylglycine dehydrogenase
VKELGGQMGAYAGWERANWFAKPGDDTSEETTQTWNRAGPWEPRIREECEAVRDASACSTCRVFAVRPVRRGPARRATGCWARSRAGLPKPGRMNLAYFPTTRGRILTEMSVMPQRRGSLHADHRRDRAMA